MKTLMFLVVAGIAVTAFAQTPPGPMPYTAIHRPEFVAASEAMFLQDDDILLGSPVARRPRRSLRPTSRSMARCSTSCPTGRSR